MLFIPLLFNSCSSSGDKIVGEWERINDDQKGMIVKVTKEKDAYVGRVYSITDINKDNGFEIGDIKWKNIEHIKEGEYKLQDLWKRVTVDGAIEEIGYGEGYIDLNNSILNISHTKDNKKNLKQEWINKKLKHTTKSKLH